MFADECRSCLQLHAALHVTISAPYMTFRGPCIVIYPYTKNERDALFLKFFCIFSYTILLHYRSQWPRGLRRRSAAARLLRSWVRIPPGAWMFVCCVLSDRGLCDGLITRPEKSYPLWCVVVCDLETSRMGAPYIYDISHLRVNNQ